jgi:hypothetical protein
MAARARARPASKQTAHRQTAHFSEQLARAQSPPSRGDSFRDKRRQAKVYRDRKLQLRAPLTGPYLQRAGRNSCRLQVRSAECFFQPRNDRASKPLPFRAVEDPFQPVRIIVERRQNLWSVGRKKWTRLSFEPLNKAARLRFGVRKRNGRRQPS